MRRFTILLLLAPFFALAGCSSSPGTAPLPKVSGSFGVSPKLTFTAGKPPTTLQTSVLERGTARVVEKKDLIVVDYLGQLWNGKVFESSFGHVPFSTPIGVGSVIPAWDKGLVGKRVGSRVLIVAPPVDAYGKSGQPSAGIKANATLAFVVDILGAYPKGAGGDPHATVLRHTVAGVTVGGPLGGTPTVSVAPGTPLPKKRSVSLIARGRGKAVAGGLVILEFVEANWSSSVAQSTWTLIPFAATVGNPTQPSTLDSLIGDPIGSRVLFDFPKTSKTPAYAVVVDIVAQPSAQSG